MDLDEIFFLNCSQDFVEHDAVKKSAVCPQETGENRSVLARGLNIASVGVLWLSVLLCCHYGALVVAASPGASLKGRIFFLIYGHIQ